MAEQTARELVVHGRVQGVFFRAFLREAALQAGVAGWAENRADGAVGVRLEGDRGAVALVERACREGPPRAQIERVDAADVEPEGLAGFDVR
jgi:acylphosphatase